MAFLALWRIPPSRSYQRPENAEAKSRFLVMNMNHSECSLEDHQANVISWYTVLALKAYQELFKYFIVIALLAWQGQSCTTGLHLCPFLHITIWRQPLRAQRVVIQVD